MRKLFYILYNKKFSTIRTVLHVAEKPSVAKAIATVLSNDNFKTLASNNKTNQIMEFKLKQLEENNNSEDEEIEELKPKRRMTKASKLKENNKTTFDIDFKNSVFQVTSVTGHLMNYDFPKELSKWEMETNIELFDSKIIKKVDVEKKTIEKNLLSLGKEATDLVLWLDCDREGENIAFEVIKVVKRVNKNINIYRAHFSSISPKEITKAVKTLQQPNSNISKAVDVRQKLDLLFGSVLTRFQTLLFKQYLFENFYPEALSNKSVISFGPCQFPTLNFIIQRYLQIKDFVSKDYFSLSVTSKLKYLNSKENIKLRFKDEVVLDEDKPDKEKKSSKAEQSKKKSKKDEEIVSDDVALDKKNKKIEKIYKEIKDIKEGVIKKIEKKETFRSRPIALNTIELTKLGTKYFKISGKYLMDIAEKLYQDGYISYPRTETQIYSKDFNVIGLINKQVYNEDKVISGFASQLIESIKNKKEKKEVNFSLFKGPNNGKADDKSHPPIHPIKILNKNKYSNDLYYCVYTFIVKHYLACMSSNAQGYETKVNIDISGYEFYCKGTEITEKGFLDIYDYESWEDKLLPNLKEKEIVKLLDIELETKKTQSPSLLNEAELISLMDKNGIGTDATIHEHINTVLSRKYCFKKGQLFVPSLLGLGLYNAFNNFHKELFYPNRRQLLEKQLVDICNGEENDDEVFEQNNKEMKKVYIKLEKTKEDLQNNFIDYLNNNTDTDFIKEKFKIESEMIEKREKNNSNRSSSLNDDDESVTERKNYVNDDIMINYPVGNCSICSHDIVIKKNKFKGEYFAACSNFPACKNTINLGSPLKIEVNEKEKCDTCNSEIYDTYSKNLKDLKAVAKTKKSICIACLINSEEKKSTKEKVTFKKSVNYGKKH